jgi:hypothetical protein
MKIYPAWVPDRLSLLIIVVVAVIVNSPYFANDYFPTHDTLYAFQIFSFYYSELFITGELPWWLPHTAFGTPIDFAITSFGPFQYLALVVGQLFGVRETLLLFSISLLLDSLLLGLGSFLFCHHILKDKFAAVVCVISILFLVFYDRQIYFNFKILVNLPLVLYLTQRSIEEVDLTYLFWATAVLLAWAHGSIMYSITLQVYIIIFYCTTLMLSKWLFSSSPERSFSSCLANFIENLIEKRGFIQLLLPSLLIVLSLAMLLAVRSSISTRLAYNGPGRDADLSVNLATYLTYGGEGGTSKLVEIFNGLPVANAHDFLVYIGLINFALVLIGLISMRKNSSHIALLMTTVLILAFTVVPTGIAELAYALPGMNLVRHIAYFITFAKLLLIILAGFGINALNSDKTNQKLWLFLIAAVLCLYFTPFDISSLYEMHAISIAVLLLILVFAAWSYKISIRFLIFGCIFLSLIDIVTYRIAIFKKADLFLASFPDEFKTVQASLYRSTRVREAEAPVLTRFRLKGMDTYGSGDSYLREDLCKGARQDLISPAIKSLFQLRVWHNKVISEPRDALDAKDDEALSKVLGCGVPKLRMVSSVRYAINEKVAEKIICCDDDIYNHPIIIAPKAEQIDDQIAVVAASNTITVTGFSSNMVRLVVRNNEALPLWLIYADSFDDRWKATIDGIPMKIFKANIAFKALKIEPGSHEVVMNIHRPLMSIFLPIFIVAISLPGLALIIWVLGGIAFVRTRAGIRSA